MAESCPRWTSIAYLGSSAYSGDVYSASCELCGPIGRPKSGEAAARKACRDHARTKLHREDANARLRAEIADMRDRREPS